MSHPATPASPSPFRGDRKSENAPAHAPDTRSAPEPDWDADHDKPVVGSVGPRGGRIARADSDTDAAGTGLERNRGPGRRRSDFMRTAEEGEMNSEQFLFIKAIDAFKRANDRMYPTWTDVLEVVRLLGYRKTMPSELNLRGVDDFREPADAKANVRRIRPEKPQRKAA